MLQVINTYEDLFTIRDSWECLVAMDEHSTAFQRFDYIVSSWTCMLQKSGLLYVVCAKDESNEISAIYPFYIDNNHTLRFINDIHTDFCRPIIRNEIIEDYHLWDAVAKQIVSDKRIKSIHLDNQMESSRLLSFFRYFFQPSVVVSTNAYPVLRLGPCVGGQHFSTAIPNLLASERRTIRKHSNKLVGLDLCIYDVQEEPYPTEMIDNFVNVMVGNKIRQNEYFQEILPLVKMLYEVGMASLFVSFEGDNPKALKVFLKKQGTNELISWLLLYTDKKYNQLNMLQCLKYISEKGGVYNFARGTYGYKMKMVRPSVYNLYSFRWSRCLGGQIMDIVYVCLYQLKQVVKKIIRG